MLATLGLTDPARLLLGTTLRIEAAPYDRHVSTGKPVGPLRAQR